MKKLFAFLLACMMLLSVTTAFAEGDGTDNTTPSTSVYTPVTPANNTPILSHTLTLTEEGVSELLYSVSYTFAESDVEIMQPSDIQYSSYAVTGKPDVKDITYDPANEEEKADFAADRSSTKTLEIDWSGVSIKEPGIYRWQVTKGRQDNCLEEDASNAYESFYLYAIVKDNEGSLTCTVQVNNSDVSAKVEQIPDTFPVKTMDLTVAKVVTGDQGSRDQYFPFTVILRAPSNATSKTYMIEGLDDSGNRTYDIDVPQNAYHAGTQNVESITMGGTVNEATAEIWLKHGQSFTIKDLPFGVSYSITEGRNTGYTTTSAVDANGDKVGVEGTQASVSDGSLEQTTTITFTNEKNAAVPTGIDLQTGAPIMGLLMAASMLLMLFIGKRKEAAE